MDWFLPMWFQVLDQLVMGNADGLQEAKHPLFNLVQMNSLCNFKCRLYLFMSYLGIIIMEMWIHLGWEISVLSQNSFTPIHMHQMIKMEITMSQWILIMARSMVSTVALLGQSTRLHPAARQTQCVSYLWGFMSQTSWKYAYLSFGYFFTCMKKIIFLLFQTLQ